MEILEKCYAFEKGEDVNTPWWLEDVSQLTQVKGTDAVAAWFRDNWDKLCTTLSVRIHQSWKKDGVRLSLHQR